MQKDKINPFQFLVLVIFFTIGSSILVVPSGLALHSRQDAWVAAVIGTVISVLVIWLFTFIGMRFPNLTYVQLNEKVFGKWLGKLFSILFVIMTLLNTANLIAHSSSFLKTQMLPHTPTIVLNSLMAIILIMAIRYGLTTFARAAEILIFVFFFLFIVLVSFIIPQIDVKNIEPFFQASGKSLIQSSLMLAVISSVNAIALLMIFPAFVTQIKKAKANFLIGTIIGGIVIIIITLLCVIVLGINITIRQVYPSYALAKVINVGNFVNRIEGFMAALWILSLYFKMVIYFFASVLGIAQILSLKDSRSLTYPLGLIVVALSVLIFPNIIYQENFDGTTGIAFSLVVGLFFPLLLLIVYAFRKKQLKKNIEN
ncbi:endospore germination permease [Psychrobacillus sp. OK032]|uniref:GerAB/ArcD/ProY family transporter n=1 Tax=Psychrobacillus sp. OK032 TaxID=1884358 RepID=UPI0008C4C018|nr:endospore germination permease [Psychrobacillus sp. OK032]SES10977.1 spore germination protein KB [Psychrobacillus sp. OK032]